MNKEALTERPLSPEEQMIASRMAGSGLYSALQLKHILFSDEDKEPDSDVLKIKLPKDRLMSFDKKGNDQNHLIGNLHHMVKDPLTMAVHGVSGFTHSQKLYDEMERKHLDEEMSNAEKEYLDMLGQIKHSSDNSPTPLVDAFVTGMVSIASSSPEDIDKVAAEIEDLPKLAADHEHADGSIHRMFGDLASPVTNLFKPVTDTAKGVTAGTTLASALAVYMLKQKMDEGKHHNDSPQRIEIEGV
jgi:hypothetical protein